jgi:hypothetical protein
MLATLAQKALDAVAGVDLNPFAVAISRFRLLVAALQVAGVRRLVDAPDFRIHVAIGDSLLHGTRFGLTATQDLLGQDQYLGTTLEHAYETEDLEPLLRILGRQYHAVVGNPPYIIVKDSALNATYRGKYASCKGKYSLGCPFTERFFDLAITRANNDAAGYVGLITTNSFMKREFGAALIEQVLPRLDLTHVIDTSGAYIPGHGTPTVILLGRHQAPLSDVVRAVMGISGETTEPDDPAQGNVWRAIVNQIDHVGSESDYVSVADLPRANLNKHPWSMGGGGAGDLKELIDSAASGTLKQVANVGIAVVTLEDDAFQVPRGVVKRRGFDERFVRDFGVGDALREWAANTPDAMLFPHTEGSFEPHLDVPMLRWFWPLRTGLSQRQWFKKSQAERGLAWFGFGHISAEKFASVPSIAFGEIATHNHFVLDRSGRVFKQTAPVIKLPVGSSEDAHLELLGLLNSSAACFWLKQVCFPKGGDHVGNKGARVRKTLWDERYAFNATNVADFPLPALRPLMPAKQLSALADGIAARSPAALLSSPSQLERAALNAALHETASLRRQMIAVQEELDWQCYRLYGLIPDGVATASFEYANPPELVLGERAFEIVLARRIASGAETTTWFARHGSTASTGLPAHWPAEYRAVVERRIALIESDRNIGLIERPEFKRRWNTPAWNDLEKAALRDWLLDRLEQPAFWPATAATPPQLTSTAKLAERAQADADFMHVAALYAGHADFDAAQLVAELVASEAVPLLPVQRYTDTACASAPSGKAPGHCSAAKTPSIPRSIGRQRRGARNSWPSLPAVRRARSPTPTRPGSSKNWPPSFHFARTARRARLAPSPCRPSTRAATS